MPQSPAESGASERCSVLYRACAAAEVAEDSAGDNAGKRKLICSYFTSHDKEGSGAARGWKRQPLIS